MAEKSSSCRYIGGGEALQSLEPTSEVIGVDEVREMLSKLLMALRVEALESGSLMVRFILSTCPLSGV